MKTKEVEIPQDVFEEFEKAIHHAFALAEVKTVEVCHAVCRNDVRVELAQIVAD